MGKKKRRSVVLRRQPILIKYCILLRSSLPINHPKRFVYAKVENIFRHETAGLIPCDSAWIKKAMSQSIESRSTVRLAQGEGSTKIYEKALLIQCFENYHDGKERLEYLNKSTPSRGRGKRLKNPTNKNFSPTWITAEKQLIKKQNLVKEEKEAVKKKKKDNEDIIKSKLDEESIIVKLIKSTNNEHDNTLPNVSVTDESRASPQKLVSVGIVTPQTDNSISDLSDTASKSLATNERENQETATTSTTLILSDTNVTHCDFNTTINFTENNETLTIVQENEIDTLQKNNEGSSKTQTPRTEIHLTNCKSCDISSGTGAPLSSRLHIRKKLTYTPVKVNNKLEKVAPTPTKSIIDETPFRQIDSSAGTSDQNDVTNGKNKRAMNIRRQKPRTIICSDNNTEPLTYEDSSNNADASKVNAFIAKLQREKFYYKKRLAEALGRSKTDVPVPKKKKKYESRSLNKKVEEVLQTVSRIKAIVDNNVNVDENTNINAVDAIINSEPDNDGKILVNGHAMYADSVHHVFEATTMKKRCNKIIDALWTRDEQLKLALQTNDNLIASGCRKLTHQEINIIKSMCRWFQTIKKLPTTDNFDIEHNHRKWISDHLKHNREMYAPEKREKYLERKRGERQERSAKKSATMEYDDVASMYEKLKCLLLCMIYDGVDATDSMEKDSMMSMKDICEEMQVYEHIVKGILTQDSCIIIEDKYYHPVDFKFEMSQLYMMLSQLKSLDVRGTNMKMLEIYEKLKGSNEYDEKMTNYLFQKYTRPIGNGKKKKEDQVYQLEEYKVMDVLFAYVIHTCTNEGEDKITYRSLVSECKKLPYCESRDEIDWKMLIMECCTHDDRENEITDDSLIGIDGTMEWTQNALMIIYINCKKLFPE